MIANDKFVRRVRVEPSGCWTWLGPIDKDGYGKIRVSAGRSGAGAHRVSYEVHVGPIPEGMHLDHLCHSLDRECRGGTSCPHRSCINPEHLEAVSAGENVRRSRLPEQIRERNLSRRARRFCKHGHEFTPENTYTHIQNGEPRRQCRTCKAAADRAHKARLATIRRADS